MIREYMNENKITIIVTEEPNVIKNLADYVIVLNNGQVEISEDVVNLQNRYENKNVEEILVSILKGEGKHE